MVTITINTLQVNYSYLQKSSHNISLFSNIDNKFCSKNIRFTSGLLQVRCEKRAVKNDIL
jgi:hypothetical protein